MFGEASRREKQQARTRSRAVEDTGRHRLRRLFLNPDRDGGREGGREAGREGGNGEKRQMVKGREGGKGAGREGGRKRERKGRPRGK